MRKRQQIIKIKCYSIFSLKQKGRGINSSIITNEHFKNIVNICFEKNISFGFDSCSACKFLNLIKNRPDYKKIATSVEPCESGLFSGYVNVDGVFSPCSFSEGIIKGFDLTKPLDFLQDIWYNKSMQKWRKELLENKRNCPIYKI